MFEQVRKKKPKPGGASSGPLVEDEVAEDFSKKVPAIDSVLAKSKTVLKKPKKKSADCCLEKGGCCL